MHGVHQGPHRLDMLPCIPPCPLCPRLPFPTPCMESTNACGGWNRLPRAPLSSSAQIRFSTMAPESAAPSMGCTPSSSASEAPARASSVAPLSLPLVPLSPACCPGSPSPSAAGGGKPPCSATTSSPVGGSPLAQGSAAFSAVMRLVSSSITSLPRSTHYFDSIEPSHRPLRDVHSRG